MTQTSDPPVTAGAQAQPSRWDRLRLFLLRMHFYAGLLVGPFLLVAAVTGLLYTLTPQVDRIVYRHELTVDRVAQHRLPLSEQLAAARAAYPQGTLTSVRPPATANETTRFVLDGVDVPPDYSRTVFVDPYLGQVRGALTTYGEWLPLRSWFDELHRTLHFGAVGRNYSELAASWLWVVALGGLALWVAQRRKEGRLRRLASPDGSASGRAQTRSWHGALGVWIVVGLLGLSVTGLTWSRYAGGRIEDLRAQLSWSAPSVETSMQAGGKAVDLGAGVDRAMAAADAAGLVGPLWIKPSARSGQAWTVAEKKRDVPTRYDSISVDPNTGAIVDRLSFAEWPFVAKLTNWAIDAHMGVLLGLVNQIVLALLAVGLICVVVLGYRMWWQRRPAAGRVGAAPRRGALGGLEPIEAVVVVVVIAAAGWFAPLLGLSLGAFVIVDSTVGSRRAGAPKVAGR